ncbi:helix-turn-helix transcriptional regulator [Thermoleophilia bacterium SCSIO 60948]|nr:helix-turn-helix transcriptional regulator [Thermoleophilia bacterium SCSIO 60948]
MAVAAKNDRAGTLLREWRRRRGLSQMELALDAATSARHLSFCETGRATPSPDLVLRLCERLDVPLRERDQILVAAGHAPSFGERDLHSPEMEPIRAALDSILKAHEPFPALAIDRGWNLVAANSAIGLLTAGVDPDLLEAPPNVVRISLHPDGLAPRIVNLAEWRAHLIDRLRREFAVSGDAMLGDLLDEALGFPVIGEDQLIGPTGERVAVPLRISDGSGGELSFLSTVATFGTALDVTAAELSIEAFLPADSQTAEALRAAAASI